MGLLIHLWEGLKICVSKERRKKALTSLSEGIVSNLGPRIDFRRNNDETKKRQDFLFGVRCDTRTVSEIGSQATLGSCRGQCPRRVTWRLGNCYACFQCPRVIGGGMEARNRSGNRKPKRCRSKPNRNHWQLSTSNPHQKPKPKPKLPHPENFGNSPTNGGNFPNERFTSNPKLPK